MAAQIKNRFLGEESFFLVHGSALNSKMPRHNTQEKPTSVCTVHCKDVKDSSISASKPKCFMFVT